MEFSYINRKLKTTQSSIVIPTKELITCKKSNIKVLACVSAISNVDNFMLEGSNSRYCSIEKLNRNLESMCKLMNTTKSKLSKSFRDLHNFKSEEFKIVVREYNSKMVPCVEMNYVTGGFIIIEYNLLEKLLSTLSNNAFKLYINLLWLCKNSSHGFIERQLTQKFLLELMGLSESSTKILTKAEKELADHSLIKIRTTWEREMDENFKFSNPKTKKYYNLVK